MGAYRTQRPVVERPAAVLLRLLAVAALSAGIASVGKAALPPPPGVPLPRLPSLPQPKDAAAAASATRNSGTPAATAPAARPAAGASPISERSAASAAALFQKHTVTGEDLLDEFKALRQAALERKSQSAANRVMGQLSATPAGKAGFADNVTGKLSALLKSSVDYSATTISSKALDGFFDLLLEDRATLAAKTIELPSPEGMTAEQQQQILTMAALVIGAEVTNDILSQAKKDFAALEKDYAALLDRREKIAKLLADVVQERRKALQARDELKAQQLESDLSLGLSKEDIEFLDRFPANMSVKEFSNDFAAQNLALQFLRQKDPQAYADYRAQTDGITNRTRAYLHTITGVASFGALLATFINAASDVTGSKNMQQIAKALPFGVKFISEALPLIALAVETTVQGVVLEPGKLLFGARHFALFEADKETPLKSASDVFAEWRKRHVDTTFGDALFRNGAPGLLWRTSVCDAGEAGRMLDSAVSQTQRVDFAKRYLDDTEDTKYSFVNGLTDPGPNPKSRQLGDTLLLHDHRHSTTDSTHALSDVQATATSDWDKWNDAQLIRLIFANHEDSIAYAQIQVGSTLVRPLPTMQSVYEYEAFVDSCRARLEAPPPAPAPAAKAGVTKAPTKKPSKAKDAAAAGKKP